MKKRDRYTGKIDAGRVTGPRAAVYDVHAVLWLLRVFAKERGLLEERVTVPTGHAEGSSYSVVELLEMANIALNTSVDEALWVYERLRQNEEAARLLVASDAYWEPSYKGVAEALTDTLNNRAIISRGFVNGARRMLARREKQNGGDAA
jgi:hypothetical protein